MLATFIILEIAQYLSVADQLVIFKLSRSLYKLSTNIRQQYEEWWNKNKQYKYTFDNVKFVEYLIHRGLFNWYRAFSVACYNGNIECVQLLINNYNIKFWNYGLSCACKGGSLECAQFMITMGATDWNRGLIAACRGGNIKCVNLMIKMGATD